MVTPLACPAPPIERLAPATSSKLAFRLLLSVPKGTGIRIVVPEMGPLVSAGREGFTDFKKLKLLMLGMLVGAGASLGAIDGLGLGLGSGLGLISGRLARSRGRCWFTLLG
jgi:hypothetical protein